MVFFFHGVFDDYTGITPISTMYTRHGFGANMVLAAPLSSTRVTDITDLQALKYSP